MLKMLKQLQKQSFQLNIDKCEFSVTKIKYLRLIVIIKGICIYLKEVQAIINQKLPILVKDMQAFLRVSVFYQQFIAKFFQKTKPLTKITKSSHAMIKLSKSKIKYNLIQQTEDCEKVFQDLKQVFIIVLILTHYSSNLKT